VKNGPDAVQHRTTYMEIGTAAQLPTDLCNVHGEPHARLVRESSESEFPRAAPAVDLNEVLPVIVKGPTLLADRDPYSSAKATAKPTPPPEPENQTTENKFDKQTPEPGATIPKAIPVQTPGEEPMEIRIDKQTPEPGATIPKAIPVQRPSEEPMEIRKAVPVGPLDEIEDETLLKSATPPPADLDE
jgi:hypothetical protein